MKSVTSSVLGTFLLSLIALSVAVGCAQTKNDKVDNPYEFQITIQNFHRDMRWGEFEKASRVATPGFRQTFLGKFEEHGEDLDIVNLEVKKVERVEVDLRRVEIEQEWIVEPNMTVNKERFVEIWERGDKGWALADRMRKREWKRRQEREADGDATGRDGEAETEAE